MIKVEKLSKYFKEVKAVKDISFEVKNGEILGLLGENGAGKTTTLRMLATMLKPTEGDATINNYSIINDSQKVRGEIGILFGGDVGLYDRLTVRENIRYFAELNGMGKKQAEESIEYLVEELKLKEYIDRRVGKLSRGMKQKVSIARSIVHRPTVMLFDEPTTGLDVTAAKLVHEFILDCKKQNKSIIFSSHSMQEVEKLCDRIIVLNKGSIVDEGTLEYFKERYNSSDMEEIFIKLVGDK
ncbi:ATP-binding cassette domain-containing protein [Haloimpatiens sp. FM7315]|uniref:ABC transporter ATP-binding protein n=1 Tax=Haloimpatiens sp. FM7315 TaxID=3298609 RepID=UPI0035A29EE2